MTAPFPTAAALHPELLPHVQRVRGLGLVLRSPLVYVVPYAAELAGFANALYEQKQAQIARAVATRNWSRVITLHERPYRPNALWEHATSMTDPEYWGAAAEVYVDTENADQLFPLWRLIVEAQRGSREQFMQPDERLALARLPDVLTVYRGCTSRRILDLSWTLDPAVADWFAHRFDAQGFVLQGEVRKADVIGYLTRRGEEEIAVLPERVSNIRRKTALTKYQERVA